MAILLQWILENCVPFVPYIISGMWCRKTTDSLPPHLVMGSKLNGTGVIQTIIMKKKQEPPYDSIACLNGTSSVSGAVYESEFTKMS